MLKGKKVLKNFAIVLALVVAFSGISFAYSYGSSETEPMAEAYKEIVFNLNKSPQNWAGATEEFEEVKGKLESLTEELNEIDNQSQFLNDYAVEIKEAIQEKDKDAVIYNFQLALAGNIERRLESAEKEINEYKTAKALIKKAKVFYETLEIVVKADSQEANERVEKALTGTLNSLGNPGMLGFGAQPPKVEEYQEHKETILNTLEDVIIK
ncbi:hypothetical protein [Selenihalanaerobacter shriftii]|uniref:Uncharacterized protein n=1 Tax=Selenihalanaerobacter shriftii TaxID=142842 RepID=A0A1T4PUV3_9FIRM|nr:hypothetical protein [Selenihalanaerobacter shriftii]SJZ95126.1 hypothetical protein SAMN02745118_02321 [Selenihalanaerobacter shriftii]